MTETGNLIETFEATSLETGETVEFLVFQRFRLDGKTYIFTVDTADLARTENTDEIPAVYAYQEAADEQIIPLTPAETHRVRLEAERLETFDKSDIIPVVTLEIEGEPHQFEEITIAGDLEEEGVEGSLVILFDVADDDNYRPFLRTVDPEDGLPTYHPITGEDEAAALEAADQFAALRKTMRSLGLNQI